MGQALRPTLDGVDVPHFTMEREDEVEKIMTGAIKLAFSTDRPVAVIVSPLLSGGKSL
jgi:sulfopyruvate decarboxylase TPP-binding subunit